MVRISSFDAGENNLSYSHNEIANSYHPTVKFPGEWRKFLPTDLTSPWWYSVGDLKKLIFSHIAETRRSGSDITLREFVRQFRGISGTAKAKAVCDQFSEIDRMSDFEKKAYQIQELWNAMRSASQPPTPGVLGQIGEDHLKVCFDKWFKIKPNRFWYVKKAGPSAKERKAGEIPYVFEVAVAQTEERGDLFTGLNFSPTYEDFLAGTHLKIKNINGQGIEGFLRDAHVEIPSPYNEGRTAIAVHLICPTLDFLDRGKTRLKVQEDE